VPERLSAGDRNNFLPSGIQATDTTHVDSSITITTITNATIVTVASDLL
jgi:hypothetical protein